MWSSHKYEIGMTAHLTVLPFDYMTMTPSNLLKMSKTKCKICYITVINLLIFVTVPHQRKINRIVQLMNSLCDDKSFKLVVINAIFKYLIFT